MRPTLLRNKGGGGFVDVTQEAGLLDPVNSNAAAWGDFDNDGWIDLFVACERQENRLFRNKGNGTFENVTNKAGVEGDPVALCKGCTWLDYDNDGYVDLYVNNLEDTGRLYHNQRDGRVRGSHDGNGHKRPDRRLRLLVVGLRQRRLARHLRTARSGAISPRTSKA